MFAKRLSALCLALFFFLFTVCPASSSENAYPLPPPQTDGGKPLMQALNERKSTRKFSTRMLSDQVLSNLLWAAWGINRPKSGKRTAPSAWNRQDIDIYLARASGLFRYDAAENRLIQISGEDIRAQTGTQSFVKTAPVNLIYVSDLKKLKVRNDSDKQFHAAAHTGFISQNVYLFCASEGLGTVVRGLVDRPALAKTMKLRPDQWITFVQSVGYPKEN